MKKEIEYKNLIFTKEDREIEMESMKNKQFYCSKWCKRN